MSDNKRYFWLKLDENFFDDDTIAWIEEQENGKDYVIFYLKLALKSLKDDGYLIRYVGQKLIPYDVRALSKLTNTPVDTVAIAMKLFIDIGLLSQLDTGEIYINQINEMIGSETSVAKRVRKSRAKKELTDNVSSKLLHCNAEVTKCNTEKKIEKELELEKERERELKKENSPAKAEPSLPYLEIVDYLNLKTKSKFRSSSQATQRLIKARFNDGFTLDDFKQVIDTKSDEWLRDKKMSIYLRPETLFSNKFEGYLNQKRQTFSNLSALPDIPDSEELPF